MKEIWKDIEGFEGHYMISNTGKVKSLKYNKFRICKSSKNKQKFNHQMVSLCKNSKIKPMLVHRLVALAFIPNPKNLATVNHKDENPLNNNVTNLEWLSIGDNVKYSMIRSGVNRGERSPFHKLTNEQVESIRKMKENNTNFKSRDIAKLFNVGYQTIYRICSYKTFTYKPL
jgi:hypothetical protein